MYDDISAGFGAITIVAFGVAVVVAYSTILLLLPRQCLKSDFFSKIDSSCGMMILLVCGFIALIMLSLCARRLALHYSSVCSVNLLNLRASY